MKSFILLIGVFLVQNGVFCQSFSVSATDTTFYGNITDNDFASKFILNNDSTTSFPMTWQVESANMETGWDYSICDPTTCHPVGTSSSNFNMPTSSTNRIINLHYYPNGNAGESTVNVKLFQQDLPNAYVLLSWTGIISTANIDSEVNFLRLMLYPNPSTDGIFQIEYEGNQDADFVLYNNLGQEIERKGLNKGKHHFELGINSGSGVYYYKVVAGDKIMQQSKLVVL